LKLVTELFKLALSDADVSLHTHTPVHSVNPLPDSGNRLWELETPRGPVSCSYVIHATNAYASHLLPHLAGPSGIIPTRGQVLAMRANAPSSEIPTSSWDGNTGSEYWVPRPATKEDENPIIMLGGGREASFPKYERYETDDSKLNEKITELLKRFLPRVFPDKFEQGREPEMSWVRSLYLHLQKASLLTNEPQSAVRYYGIHQNN
jgi:glycine/D-amino acid oxidase-like deaminating enzyme